jgi:hypothetical protein
MYIVIYSHTDIVYTGIGIHVIYSHIQAHWTHPYFRTYIHRERAEVSKSKIVAQYCNSLALFLLVFASISSTIYLV